MEKYGTVTWVSTHFEILWELLFEKRFPCFAFKTSSKKRSKEIHLFFSKKRINFYATQTEYDSLVKKYIKIKKKTLPVLHSGRPRMDLFGKFIFSKKTI